MTDPQKKEFWKTWAPLGVSMVGIAFAATINLIIVAHWAGKIDQRITQNSESITQIAQTVVKHSSDRNLHMPFDEKIEVFPTRTEWDRENKLIREDLGEIKGELREMNKKLDNYLSNLPND